MSVLGGNLSEERFSPTCLPRQAPPSKDFSDVPAGAVTSALKAQEFLKGGPASEGRMGKRLAGRYVFSVCVRVGHRQESKRVWSSAPLGAYYC